MSRKQVGVIYRAFKEGKLENVDKEDMSNVYAYVDRMNDFDFARREGYVDCGHLCSPTEIIWSDLAVVEMVKKIAEQLKAGDGEE